MADAQSIVLLDDSSASLFMIRTVPALSTMATPMRKRSKACVALRSASSGVAARRGQDVPPRLFRPLHRAGPDPRNLVEARRDGGEQKIEVDRLDKIVVGSRLLADEESLRSASAVRKMNGTSASPPSLAHGLEDFVAAETWHGDVAEDEIGPALIEHTQRLDAVRSLEHIVIGGFQFVRDVDAQVVLVLDA